MIRFSPKHWRMIVPMLFGTFFFSACSSSGGVDNYFTFNLNKTFIVVAPAGAAVWPPATAAISLKIDSSDLTMNGTSLALIKSVELTKLTFSSSSAAYPFSDIDTLVISTADSVGTQLIANYSGAADSMSLSDADIARYIKNPKATYSETIGYHKAPPESVTFTGNYTLVVTAQPLP